MNIKIIMIVVGLLGVGVGAKYFYFDPQEAMNAQLAKQQEQEAVKQEALKKFMNQGNGKIRKPGESGFKSFDLSHL